MPLMDRLAHEPTPRPPRLSPCCRRAPARDAAHRQELRRRARAPGRVVDRGRGRGPRPLRRERRGQEHADEDPGRRDHRIRRRDPLERPAGPVLGPARGRGRRHPDHLPGAEPGSPAHGRRQHLPGPRKDLGRPARLARQPRDGGRATAALRPAGRGRSHPRPRSATCGSAISRWSRSPRRWPSTPRS